MENENLSKFIKYDYFNQTYFTSFSNNDFDLDLIFCTITTPWSTFRPIGLKVKARWMRLSYICQITLDCAICIDILRYFILFNIEKVKCVSYKYFIAVTLVVSIRELYSNLYLCRICVVQLIIRILSSNTKWHKNVCVLYTAWHLVFGPPYS